MKTNPISTVAFLFLVNLFMASTNGQVTYLDQGWDRQHREEFYFTPQGSQLVPYSWFVNLEQSDSEVLFRDPANMRAYGYLPLKVSERNPHGLPIGFVRDGVDPKAEKRAKIAVAESRVIEETTRFAIKKQFLGTKSNKQFYPKEQKAWLGLTCAACHTHEIEFGDHVIRIDGGSTQADFETFLSDLGVALEATRTDKEKLKRFAKKLGRGDSELSAFEKELSQISAAVNRRVERNKAKHPYGYARLDAFGAILNAVCETALGESANRRESNAPVSYPSLWNTAQMGYVQSDASAAFAEGRNVGQVLGVFGLYTLDAGPEQFDSTIRLKNLIKLEHDLVAKLKAPDWPEELLGELDSGKVESGRILFAQNCQSCHPIRNADGAFELNSAGRIPIRSSLLSEVNTDGQFLANVDPCDKVLTKGLSGFFNGKEKVARGVFLKRVVQLVLMNRAKAELVQLKPPKEQAPANPNGSGYIARPLEGIWANAPYFHNGSVPNLYETLVPSEKRSKSFWVGSRKFDANKVGLFSESETPESGKSGFEFRVLDEQGKTITGNSNKGHEGHGAKEDEGFTQTFENGHWRDFTESEILALIEYMKSLSSKPKPVYPKVEFEQVPEGEAKRIENIVDFTIKQMQSRYKNGKPMLRNVHPKDHGCVKAKFEVNSDLPEELAVGVFQRGASYQAFIRFSNADVVKRADSGIENDKVRHGSRGMAIKLLGVTGEPLFDLHGAQTQDFLMVNQPAFAFANVEDYEALSQALAMDPKENKDDARPFFARLQSDDLEIKARAVRTREIIGRVRADEFPPAFQRPPASPVDNTYFSAAPFLFGQDRVMKYRAKPVDPSLEEPNVADPNYLRNALIERLKTEAVVFEFGLQIRDVSKIDIASDIENASTEWKDKFITVARIVIPPQEFDTPEHRLVCERLFFTPWHGITEHRPIGGINRLRKAVYIASSRLRSLPKEPAPSD